MMRHILAGSLTIFLVSMMGTNTLAQNQKRRVVVPAAQPAMPTGKKLKTLRRGPSLGSERFVRRRSTQQQAESKWQGVQTPTKAD